MYVAEHVKHEANTSKPSANTNPHTHTETKKQCRPQQFRETVDASEPFTPGAL